MVYDVAFGTKRKDVTPRQEQMDWTQIAKRLKKVHVCEHTMSQYKEMSKAQRVEVKDVGYFIGGSVHGRKVVLRQLLVLDIDEVKEDTAQNVRRWLEGHAYILHTTHSSTPESPRFRVVTPLSRNVSADEYGAVMRAVHTKFDIPVDISTFDFNRIMFLPSVPKDAKYFFEAREGEPIQVDDVLSEIDNWRDLSELSVPKVKVQDPKYKGGIIGAFCSKVSIREAIDEHLQGVWKKESNGRYTLIGASTVGGGIIYEDKYLYSNHSTDRYLGRCHNAYDAVRLYKYGEGAKGDAAMISLCDALGIQADSGKMHALTIDSMDDEDSKSILKERLTTDKHGNLEKTLLNTERILTYDPDLKGVIGYDLFSEIPVLRRYLIGESI